MGNALNFLVTERLVRHLNGHLLLRIDDLDAERMRPEYVEDIFRSLEWLGIRWDEGPSGPDELERTWSQRHRLPRYRQCLTDLRAKEVLYACDHSRTTLHGALLPGRPYCAHRKGDLSLDTPDMAWRLRIPTDARVDLHRFQGGADPLDLLTAIPDPVLRKRNGTPGYQIASLCDDLDLGVDLIVRGSDLLPSSACQVHLAQVLGQGTFSEVRFVHHPLVVGRNGRKLSKSAGADSLKVLRERGAAPSILKAKADKWIRELLKAGDG
ncbi:MAG: tRNA glutamyl-Q synthetase [Flavobacteriales bacterium]|nr:hypothetical protein [Flavobacteriales bacterium]MCB9165946.1 tRNA glutamyl-Q synthetase [Flavobacteriales bacterium]